MVATSGANHCTYCVVAHGAILRIRAKDPEIADHVATNPWRSSCRRASGPSSTSPCCWRPTRRALTEADLDAARAAGLTEDEIWDVGAITALFAMSNRLAHLTALRPNPEFFLMGRLRAGDAGRDAAVTTAAMRHGLGAAAP